MKTDIQIAQEATMLPIKDVAASIGIEEDDLELYGKYKAKISDELINRTKKNPDGKLILVTAINRLLQERERQPQASVLERHLDAWERKHLSHFVSRHLDLALVSREEQPVADMHRLSQWRI